MWENVKDKEGFKDRQKQIWLRWERWRDQDKEKVKKLYNYLMSVSMSVSSDYSLGQQRLRTWTSNDDGQENAHAVWNLSERLQAGNIHCRFRYTAKNRVGGNLHSPCPLSWSEHSCEWMRSALRKNTKRSGTGTSIGLGWQLRMPWDSICDNIHVCSTLELISCRSHHRDWHNESHTKNNWSFWK